MQAVTLISQNRTVCSFFTVWLLRREGDHELIMAFTLVQTYSTCRHSSQVGHSCWMNCSTFALKIPALTQGDKQNSELMKPLLSWFSAASPAAVFTSCEISFREYLTWLFFFFCKPFLNIMSWAAPAVSNEMKPSRPVAPIVHCSYCEGTPSMQLDSHRACTGFYDTSGMGHRA